MSLPTDWAPIPNVFQRDASIQNSQLDELKKINKELLQIAQNQAGELTALQDLAKTNEAILVELIKLNTYVNDVLHPHLVKLQIIPGDTPTTH
jgi:hypothetical protein